MHLNISYLGYLQSPCTIFVCARLLFYQPKISCEIRGGMQNIFVMSNSKCDIQMSDMICFLLALFNVYVKIFHPHTDLDLNC